MNPYYDSDKLGWDIFTLDRPDLSYEFDTLCFWKDSEGTVYSASDTGCSCPVPFENYQGETPASIAAQLERVPNLAYALGILRDWNNDYGGRPKLPLTEFLRAQRELEEWFM